MRVCRMESYANVLERGETLRMALKNVSRPSCVEAAK